MNDIRIEPTVATLGAVVTGLELASVTDAEWTIIESAFHEYAVLVLPAQHLSDTEQTAFGRRFGELSIESLTFTNCTEDGSLLPPEDPLMRHLAGNEGWHTDSSFQQRSAKASMLTAACAVGRRRDRVGRYALPTTRSTTRPAAGSPISRPSTRCTTPRPASG
jgi:alpha-ketoglutarate-dependent taurine dioxygenase